MKRTEVLPQSNTILLSGFLLSRQVMDCRPTTLRDYRSRLGQFERFMTERHPTAGLVGATRQHVEEYIVLLSTMGRASWTLRTNHRALRAFYRWMIEERFIEESPLRNIKPPKTPKVAKAFITVRERDKLLSVCPVTRQTGARSAAMLWLLWSTGMRLAELVGLQRVDLDYDRGRIRVLGKGRKERLVPFSREAKRAVWRYMTYRRDDLPAVWLTEEGTPIGIEGVKSTLVRLYVRADVHVKDKAHVFRRSWAARNLRAGIPIKDVQIIGGWESVTTLEGYVRAMTSEDALSADWQ